MFSSKTKSAAAETAPGSISIIGAGTVITGNIDCSGDIRIDGILKGNINCKGKTLIGPEGVVEGDINGKTADILGTVQGAITMSGLLHLHGKATVEGDIQAAKLQIESTVNFNGQCQMGANIVELKASPELAKAVNG